MSALDEQVGGNHYTDMAIQPMEFSMKNNLDACQHTAIKYIARFRNKGGIEDLKKAKHVIDMLIEFELAALREHVNTPIDLQAYGFDTPLCMLDPTQHRWYLSAAGCVRCEKCGAYPGNTAMK